MSVKPFIKTCQERVNLILQERLPRREGVAKRLYEAMHYGVLNGGKRLRPALVYATVEALGGQMGEGDDAACAIEMTHCYSLIHDDLPAMDDDDLRRGKPTCHIEYDEATAILAADALQAQAFEVIANSQHSGTSNENKLKMIAFLSKCSGSLGMIGGQAIDLASVGRALSLTELKQMHTCKTGALVNASVTLGALATNRSTPQQLDALSTFAISIGLAFQIKDDILDVEGDTQTLGKKQGADLDLNKPTYTSLLGLEKAREDAQRQHQKAIAALDLFDHRADTLRELATYIIERNH